MGTIHLFRKPQRSFFGKLLQEFRLVAADRRSWKILLFGAINVLCTGFLLMWCSSTNSIALTAYTYLTIFDLFSDFLPSNVFSNPTCIDCSTTYMSDYSRLVHIS
uniref:Solute carrier family 30 (zinc transporter), member 6 n=2 Tax=Mus TaxID=862507 RepID=A0A3B2WCW5_MOUSE